MNSKMAITPKGLKFMIAGVIVMIAGFILLAGGASSDPEVFSWDIFNFRRLVAAPIVILAGVVVTILGIMNKKGE